jgi:RNA polymerase sigma-70 factor (ECF subfamily)
MEPPTNPAAARDPNEDFLRLFTHHEPTLRAYLRACLPTAVDVDEVMQEVSLVAWRKFSALPNTAQFVPWVCMIARYEMLMHRRRHARDRLVLDEDIIATLAAEGAEEMPAREAQLRVLEDCIGKLPEERRELTLTAYAPETSMRALAARMGRTEGSLYQMLARTRRELLRCVERTLAQEVKAS